MRTTALIGIAALASAPASATVYQFNWTGTVDSLQVNTAATAIQVNDAASASFTFDDAGATYVSTAWQSPEASYSIALANAAFSIGALSVALPSLGGALYVADDWMGRDGFEFDAMSAYPAYDLQLSAFGPGTTWSGTSLANGFPLGSLTDQRLTLVVGQGASREVVSATMHATVRVLGAIPEPASWAMMITGFAMIGGAVRVARRRGALRLA